jgi:hypothetical protein
MDLDTRVVLLRATAELIQAGGGVARVIAGDGTPSVITAGCERVNTGRVLCIGATRGTGGRRQASPLCGPRDRRVRRGHRPRSSSRE